MRFGRYHIQVDWSHVALVVLLAGFSLWHMFDTRSVSTNLQNTMLIVPVALIVSLLGIFVLAKDTRVIRLAPGESFTEEQEPKLPFLERFKIPLMMALFSAYIFSLMTIGFDVATFVFIALALLLQGERRLGFVLIYSLVFSGITAFGLNALLPNGVPTLIL